MASGSSTYIRTPWQSTTSKEPGRKWTPVSRPSPSIRRTRSRMPSGSVASDSRATLSIAAIGFEPGHRVPGAGQAQGLGALAHADVQHAQAPAHRETPGYLLVELTGHELLADDVAQPAEALEPGAGGPGEPGRLAAQGRSPRLTCGLGSRSRRIWSVRIRP